MSSLHGITVKYALQLDCFKGAKLVAGQDGLERIITSVNVMEVPDILSWVKEGEILLTTGFSIKDDRFAQEQLIPELAEHGLSALAVKPKRYLDELPPAMIKAANDLSFPLIELPPHASHPNLLQGIYAELVNRQASLLKKTAEVHEKMMGVLLKGGGLEEIVHTLSHLVDNPVVIYDSEGKVLAASLNAESQLSYTIDFPPRDVQKLRVKRETFLIDGENKRGVICPVVGANTLYGQIAVWEQKQPLREIDLIAIGQASALAAISFLQQKTVKSMESKYRNELLFDWLQGKIFSVEELNHRASLVGWDLENNFVLQVIDIDEYSQVVSRAKRSASALYKIKDQIQRIISKVMEHGRDYYILGERGSIFILLIRIKASWSSRAIKEKAREMALLLQAEFNLVEPKISCSIGIGRYYKELLDLKYSYEQALKAIEIGRAIKGKGSVTNFEDLGIYRLIYHSDQEETTGFLNDIFMPLQKYDQLHHTELVPTLEVFFKCNGNLSRMAREMYTHYNTVVYRLDRIKELTGIDLDDPEQRLNLQVALKIAMMNDPSPV